MQCPVCPESTLAMSNREGIEIDYCPKCRGVWLDRGELDKLIERSMAGAPAPTPLRDADPRFDSRSDSRPDPRYAPGSYRSHDDDDDDYRKHPHGKRRRGFLGDLFDFD